MKQLIIMSVMAICCITLNAQNIVNREGNTFSITNPEKEARYLNTKIDMFQTPFKFKDEYGESYTIYISYDGNCYVGKVGKTSSGMKAVPSDITKQIRKEMGIVSTNKILRVIVAKDKEEIRIFKITSVFTDKTLVTSDNHPTEFFAHIIAVNSKNYRKYSSEYIKGFEILSIKIGDSIDDL